MKKKDMTILKEQLNESAKSLMFFGIVILITLMLGNSLRNKGLIVPEWFFIFVDYIVPWILALIQTSLIIRVIKIKRAMKNLE